MVTTGYRIVDGKKVPTKKQKEREKDPSYREKLAKSQAKKEKEARLKTAYEAQEKAPAKQKVTVLPTIELGQKPEEKKGGITPQGEFLGRLISGEADVEEIKSEAIKFAKGLGIAATIGAGVYAVAGGITAVATRAIAGRAVPELIAFGAKRFATNPKTLGLTSSLIVKIGVGVGAASLLIGAIGSYPFAGFLKEEALQALSLPTFKAIDAGDLEGAKVLIGEVDEILDNKGSILSKIPYANVMESVSNYFDAAAKANNEWKRIIEIKTAEATGEAETPFARERRESDEAAFERKREFAAEEEERYGEIQQASDVRRQEQIKEDEERFAGYKEAAGEERAAQFAEEEERFAGIREASQQRELTELRFKEEYFALIRDEKYDEAAALLDAYEATLKGG